MKIITANHTRTCHRAARLSIFAVIAALGLLATPALAASPHPKRGAHFRGRTSEGTVNGFFAPVTFTVSNSGGSLTSFRYSALGCFGAGGFQPGVDYFTRPGFIISVGKVKVSASGHFSATGAVSAHSGFGNTTTTISAVSGSFTKPTSAKGTITFSQKITGKFSQTCGPARVAFTATAH
jgi:hypothetical protein